MKDTTEVEGFVFHLRFVNIFCVNNDFTLYAFILFLSYLKTWLSEIWL